MRLARLAAPLALLVLAACASKDGLNDPPPELGDFRMGHNVVVGETARQVPPTRSATAEEWEAVLTEEIGKRLGRHQGAGLYHIGVSVDAYALAIPGVPVVLKPRSVLVLSVTVWDNATRSKINVEPGQLTVFENLGLTGESIVGSGITQSREQQMQNLATAASRTIERWLTEHKDWFSSDPALREAARAEAAVVQPRQGPTPGN
ncbi:MAG: hypothetical protein OEM24_13550 [Paracoccaceae bacterium]|nr:hypothetical protein [Paracoccaceae bacterium]